MDIENHLRLICDGKAIEGQTLCDYSLEDQNKEIGKKLDSVITQFTPICRKTVCYIAAAVIFNEKGECLMMQEAKTSCAGLWYIPAGRVEPGELFVNAVKREVLEETGHIFEPSTLIAVENADGSWYRFVFTGSVVGGKLKTTADSESLQASWIANPEQLSLRSHDILPLLAKAKTYWERSSDFHSHIMPAIKSHSRLLLRIVVIIKKKEKRCLFILQPSPCLGLREDCHSLTGLRNKPKAKYSRFYQTVHPSNVFLLFIYS
ncbi:nudix hydrolase-like protein [Leptotrombidium deliense]|uniref:Nudix hydrolase-like protein n=1 Tax=Leptotrombidium deliense TaxID=299467 RepID=A0A443S865_9ACAR|nr:nudix hydrolase-like protein [Leptotrombidium deliense]